MWRVGGEGAQAVPAPGCHPGPYLVSSATSTSAGAVMGALECPAVGSSAFSSPLVEFSACVGGGGRQGSQVRPAPPLPLLGSLAQPLTWFLLCSWALSRG